MLSSMEIKRDARRMKQASRSEDSLRRPLRVLRRAYDEWAEQQARCSKIKVMEMIQQKEARSD